MGFDADPSLPEYVDSRHANFEGHDDGRFCSECDADLDGNDPHADGCLYDRDEDDE